MGGRAKCNKHIDANPMFLGATVLKLAALHGALVFLPKWGLNPKSFTDSDPYISQHSGKCRIKRATI